jgi:hypothetical protein
VPDISGFVGADTVACVLATGLDRQEEMTLLVDIGTNGEMVMGNRHRMVACSTAAGPALEGANIRFGMRGMAGAIDHVTRKDGKIVCSVIGGTEPQGICGSGLIDAVAAALELGLINSRGRIQNESRRIPLTEQVFLTQEDIREIQLAKGAIAAGIRLMAKELGITMEQIDRVYLAGAFGSYLDPESACRMGLLPPELAVVPSAAFYLEIMPRTVHKGQGILDICRVLGLRPEQVLAFGDAANDIPMLRQAGVGVAMGNAGGQVQAAADLVTGTNNDDGIVTALERLGLLDGN